MVFIKNLFKKPIVIVAAVVLIIIVGYFSLSGSKAPTYNSIVVQRGSVLQEVSVTGRVKPAQSVDLAFEKGGKVAVINVAVGDIAVAGQTLMRLENGDLYAQLLGAQANLKSQTAQLAELKSGTRPEEIEIQKVKVANAELALGDAKTGLIDVLQDAYVKSDDAIRNKVDQFFNNPRTSSPTINFSANSSQIKYDLELGRLVMESTLVSWNSSLTNLTVNSDLSLYIRNAKNNLTQIKSFLDEASLSVNALTANSNLTQTTIDGWKAAVYTARTNIGTATANLSTSEESLNSAESDVTLAKNELVLDRAGTVPEQILAQEANVEKAQANVTDYSAQLAKSIIRSPINGIVTAQNTKVGEIVPTNTVVVSVISRTKFEMETNVAEADISKVEVGDFASVTLDAYGSDVFFDAKVTAIDPAETIIEGVATYKTTLQFISEDARVKSGMTANIDINTAKLDNVLAIPQRAIISKDGDKSVQILINNTIKEVPVKIGLRGSDGKIEIIEGVKEGDTVVIPS